MSTIILTLVTGVGLGALYFLVASGLSLIYGLMHVLNFAHGAFLTLSAFLGWMVAQALGTESWWSFLVSILVGAAVEAPCGEAWATCWQSGCCSSAAQQCVDTTPHAALWLQT